jgi:hypothetical protein
MPVQPSQEPYTEVSNDRRSPSREWRVAVLLFLFLNCVYLLTSTGRARSIDEIDPVMQSNLFWHD